MTMYVDGFVIPVPNKNKDAYVRMAQVGARVFKRHGALNVVECWGDDVPEGKLTSFPFAVKLEPDETVVFSWIVWPSKAARDKGNKAAMEDPDFDDESFRTVFDGKRLIFGGFTPIVEG
jgi:uncharacterized protein YbaA (DUF1428 family)